MYRTKPSFVYGFHGTDRTVAKKILNGNEDFVPSNNPYDWLGSGVYFWENDVDRAMEYATEAKGRKNSTIVESFALGAVIDLGNCLDLLNQENLLFLKEVYEVYKISCISNGKELAENKRFNSEDFDFRSRQLDCAVVRLAVEIAGDIAGKGKNEFGFDTVRAAFLEGEDLYPGAGFRSKNHIQIAVLNPDCIKGVFLPRDKKKIEMKKQS